jgi:methyl-accepting chemotaxis protein
MNEMSSSSSQVNLSAQELSKLSESLKQMVDQFKV